MKTAAVVAALLLAVATAAASPPSEAIRRKAVDLAYDLEFEAAGTTIRQAIALEPDEPANHLALASIAWVQMLFLRGGLTVEEHLGPPSLADVSRTPLKGTLTDDLRAALAIDPARKDAGLIVGTYRYLVATLSPVARWLAYLAGFGGGKAVAMSLLEECASATTEAGIEARFALIITYNREGRFDDALRQLEAQRDRYPQNRLFWLETGATLLRAGRPREALVWLNQGMSRLESDARPRSFGEIAWWHYMRGRAFAQLGQSVDARREAEAEAAAAQPAYGWVRGRIFTLSGQADDLAGRRTSALLAYHQARDVARATSDHPGVQDAERWIDSPFRGTSASPARQYQ